MIAQAALLALPALGAATAASAQPRVALVIGNNSYLRIPQLNNSVNDAVSIAQELRKSGFQIIPVIDGKAQDIIEAKRRFLGAIGNGGIGVFFFSGHGVQVEGRNYLLPVDFAADSLTELAREGISVPVVLDEIDRAKPKLNIVILDSCRDNPFAVTTPASARTRGLSEVGRFIPSGTLVLYAASSNQTALDALPGRRSTNGLFSGELLAAMKEDPALEIRDLAQKVRYSVMEKALSAGHLQVPALYDNLSPGAFYLSPPPVSRSFQPAASLPQRITLIIPFAPQSPSDGLVRAMAPFLSRVLSREVVLENQIDVQGERTATLIADGPKDGSVLLVSPYATAARRLEANDARLTPIGIFADTPLSLFVNGRNDARNLSDLVAASHAAARRLRMTVPLRGSPAEMCGLQVQKKLGIADLASVNGEAIAVSEVINATADLTCASAAAVRPMASQPNARIREIAEVRSTASPFARRLQVESTGAQGFDIVAPNWLGLFASSELKAELARSLSAAVARLQEDPAYAQAISRFQALPVSAEQATADGLQRILQLAVALQK